MADRKVQPQCKRLQLSSNRTVGIQSNLKSNRCTHDRNRIRKYSGRARAVYRSFFDILLTYSRCPRLTGYVAKKEMEKIPLLSTWMRFVYCLFLDRENPKEGLKTILQAIDYVKQGISICIFPEGTRNKGEELSMLPFKEGAFKIAAKTGCAIVPISMNNTAAIFENQFPRIKKVNVVVEYGTPIYPKDLAPEDKKHIGAYVQNIIQETINKNAELI
jgi:1-acyl-sn-glycerol-3-phosphate acyltransferase